MVVMVVNCADKLLHVIFLCSVKKYNYYLIIKKTKEPNISYVFHSIHFTSLLNTFQYFPKKTLGD